MEHGFWDYTCQGAGGMEMLGLGDHLLLLDDMAAAGMNSLVVVVRWYTMGYRSRLGFLGESASNPVIASDNELLRRVIDEAHARRIKVRLGACAMTFDPRTCGGTPVQVGKMQIPGFDPASYAVYDADSPGFTERAAMIFEELVELFPVADGLVIELEHTGIEAPHRIRPYNRWAEENGRRPIDEIGRPFDPRVFDCPDWRDYATHSRLNVLAAIERAVQAAGFAGDLGMICETAGLDYSAHQELNLSRYHAAMPDWFAVTYEYNKSHHRYAMMDFCIETPKREGLKTFYLPRGVMTWSWPLPISIEDSWRMDVEDIAQFRPDGVWWFGCGTKNDGCHVSESLLRETGYPDGVAARRALIHQARGLSAIA